MMNTLKTARAYLIGGGIGSLAAAAFMIRDGKVPGAHISILESAPLLGGSLDGAGDPARGYSLRGGRMLTTDNYECTWDLYKTIPSLTRAGKTVFDETVEFNENYKAHSLARLVDSRRAKVPVTSMGFSMQDRVELLKLSNADEDALGASRITDWLSPWFFETEFWYMWVTTFAFQPWHSAVEFKRYLHRFMLEFSRIETLAGVKRTIYNQYDSWCCHCRPGSKPRGPFRHRLQSDGPRSQDEDGQFAVTGIHCSRRTTSELIVVDEGDLVFIQNGSMTDASSLGSMTTAPPALTKVDSGGWTLWEKLAEGRPEFGNPAAFNSCVAQSCWESFTVTLKSPAFFDQMNQFSGNEPGTGGLVTFKDSNWLMSIVLAHQPHFANQPADVQVFWGYSLSRTGWATSSPNRWPTAPAPTFFRSCAATSGSISRPWHRPTASRAGCRTSPACSCPGLRSDRPLPVPQDRGISRSSASSSRSRTTWSSRSSIRCGRRRWPSTSCSASIAKSLQSRRTTSRFARSSRP